MPISSYVRNPAAPRVIISEEHRWIEVGGDLTIALEIGEARTFLSQWRQALDQLEASLPNSDQTLFERSARSARTRNARINAMLHEEPSDAA